MSTTDTIDSTAVDIVAPPRVTHEVLIPLDVHKQAAAMKTYQEGLASILDASDWQDAGGGARFVKKSGWRKIAAWFNLSIELISDDVERGDDGSVMRARVWARAIAPNGRFADADGYCDVSESRFRHNKAKLENDLRGTASTRAINRAISNLVGMGAVSAEEMTTANPGPTYGPACSPAQLGSLRRAVAYLFPPPTAADAQVVDAVITAIVDRATYLPIVSMQSIAAVAQAVKAAREAASPEVDEEEDAARQRNDAAIAVLRAEAEAATQDAA